jgi:hypothetical protein
MRPAVASQLQTWWLHMTEFLVVHVHKLLKLEGNKLKEK